MPRHGRGWRIKTGKGQQHRPSAIAASLAEPALLSLIQREPSYGYSLLTQLKKIGLNTLHPSVVYRILRDMEDLGWISSDWETSQTMGPPRRIYHLSSQGEEALQDWKQELAGVNEIIRRLIE